jgi:hypothetical protein
MIYALMGYLHAAATERVRAIRSLAEGERGQGTVEYVGLILLVSLLMVGMVAAMKGFNRFLSKTGHPNAPLRQLHRNMQLAIDGTENQGPQAIVQPRTPIEKFPNVFEVHGHQQEICRLRSSEHLGVSLS